jgi:signal transduction histidine kinase
MPFGSPLSVLHRLRRWMPYGVLAFTLALTVAVTTYVSYTEEALVPMAAIGGILTSVALFAVTLLEFRARTAAERVAADLRAAEADREHLLASEREAHRQAQAANAAKDEFLATLSHELRTPLNAILGWTRMVRAGQLDEEREAHALEVVERNARALAGLVEDLLDVSRIIVGKLRVNARSVDLVAVVQAAIEAARPAAETKGVTLGASLRAAGVVRGDADRLQQVVGNLLSNAIKFTPAGGRVDVGLVRLGATLEDRKSVV